MQNAPARLVAGAAAPAPDGLMDYCLRAPEDCADAPRLDLRGRITATGAASFQTVSANAAGEGSVFHAMMAARLAQPQATPRSGSSRMALTDARWQQLRRVNREINRAIQPSSDRALFGIEEYWQRPLLTIGRGARGDCEDYALEKRARLLALGWAPDMLAMAVAVAPRIGLHATLVVQTDRGDFVLDNLSDAPRALAELDYLWISRQVGPSLTSWAAAYPVGVRPSQNNDLSPEAMFERLMRERAPAPVVQPTPVETPVLVAAPSVAARVEPAPKPQPGRRGKPATLMNGMAARAGVVHIAP
jgi:predicted transglutaminase-like cysteine proteinase